MSSPDADPSAVQPEPIRFYGTTWTDHSGGYAARRAGLALGALALAAAGAFLLRLAYEGFELAEVGQWANVLVVVMFAVCSSVGFTRTWASYQRRAQDPERERQMRSIVMIGFIGVLLAYTLRSCAEAPGEKLARAEWEAAKARRAKRRGNPSKRKRRS